MKKVLPEGELKRSENMVQSRDLVARHSRTRVHSDYRDAQSHGIRGDDGTKKLPQSENREQKVKCK